MANEYYAADHLVWLTYISATSHFLSLQLHHSLCMQCALRHPNFIMCKAHRISSTCCSTVHYLDPAGFEWIKEAKEKNISRDLSFQAFSYPFYLFGNCFKYHWKHICSYRGAFNFIKMTERQFPIELDYSN